MSIAKLTVILLLIFIVASLGLALFHMMRNKGPTDRMVRALTIRVILSIGLFIFLMVAFATGLLKPHGIY
jgi:hypothetical protein